LPADAGDAGIHLLSERIADVAAHFAGQLALLAFAVAELRGLLLGGDFSAATKTALLAAAALFALGLVAGSLARRIVEESARQEFLAYVTANETNTSESATTT
jgi:hypothetical protein